ncbi:MAG: Icc-like protein [Desulfobacterales bacterium]|nr:MAG: Icc-like protein [Desulfobacterales bacterium]
MGICHLKKHNLRILTVSDVVDNALIHKIEKKSLGPVDLIFSCGDLSPEYISMIKERVDAPLYYVKGNHDIRYRPDNTMGCENIHGRVITVGSLNILGLEGSMWYNGGPNQYTEAQMKKIIFWMAFKIWRKKPIHMVVTHAAPRHIHDKEDPCHRGFQCFNRLIEKITPDYFIHGHIHGLFDSLDARTTHVNTTRIINTCGHVLMEI